MVYLEGGIIYFFPSDSFFENTLAEGTIGVLVQKNQGNLSQCTTPLYSEYSGWSFSDLLELGLPEIMQINNNTFYRHVYGDADMQASYQYLTYKILNGNVCYGVGMALRWSSALYKADYSEQEIADIESNRKIAGESFIEIFKQILSTFRFLE